MRAALYTVLDSGLIQCRLCRHFCRITSGQRGKCGVRQAVDTAHGPELETLVGEGVAACNVDPVEKKPLYHYLPGSLTYSIGTMGCNFDCAWCQNDSLSRFPAETGQVRFTPATPDDLVQAARSNGCASIAFTYNEPTMFYELMIATADKALEQGLGTILVSNGYQSPDCLDGLRRRIQAANIDLKAFRESTYRNYCGATLQPVLDNLRQMKAFGWWLEITTLIVPGLNDSPAELGDIARFISRELGPDTPWHISAFRPCRNMLDKAPTSLDTLVMAADIGQAEGLRFVYIGNAGPGLDRATLCPDCSADIIKRRGFQCAMPETFHGKCPACGLPVPGIWNLP